MTLSIIFYIFSVFTIIGGACIIGIKNPVIAVITKVFTFLFMAVVWLTMQQIYLALLLILVYVGAVLVMFLFVVMMLDIEIAKKQGKFLLYWPVIILFCAGFILLISILIYDSFEGQIIYGGCGSLKALGHEIFQDQYLYALELVAMILLAAMVAAITLTFRGKRPDNKSLNPLLQINTDPYNRIRMIKMISETHSKDRVND